MKKENYVIALDIGTSSLRAILFNSKNQKISYSQYPITQIYPDENLVEQNADEIFQNTIKAIKDVLNKENLSAQDISIIGITNQRETTIIWDKYTQKPIYNAIVWQDRRTEKLCNTLVNKGFSKIINEKTGLKIEPYFSATKINWLLQKLKPKTKNILFGTVDSWLLWKLTNGKSHFTDYSNASRTLLFNIKTLEWDSELLKIFAIPKEILPEVKNSSHHFGNIDKKFFGSEIPITAILGDQQASLYGHNCLKAGNTKITYGTGCFLLANIGSKIIHSKNGFLTTIGWGIDNKITYALEGCIYDCASMINWLVKNLAIAENPKELDKLVSSVKNSSGIKFENCFSGEASPSWDMHKRASISGISLANTRADVAFAAYEALCLQVKNMINLVEKDTKIKINEIKIDGGVSASKILMQMQKSYLQHKIKISKEKELTALGIAKLARLNQPFPS
ncbi:MAG: glycerol kinase GlpK [Rickettsiales bacterium]|nr:glycerol kinase GlpK [Rickettsiales bacterium]